MKWHGQVWIFGIQGQVTTMWIVKSGQIMNLSKSFFFFIVISASFYKDQIKTYMNHDMTKPTMWLCPKWRFGSAWASAQSDQGLRLSGQRRFWSAWASRLGGCPGWSESSLGAHSFCWFCHVMAHMDNVHFILRLSRANNRDLTGRNVWDTLYPTWSLVHVCLHVHLDYYTCQLLYHRLQIFWEIHGQLWPCY